MISDLIERSSHVDSVEDSRIRHALVLAERRKLCNITFSLSFTSTPSSACQLVASNNSGEIAGWNVLDILSQEQRPASSSPRESLLSVRTHSPTWKLKLTPFIGSIYTLRPTSTSTPLLLAGCDEEIVAIPLNEASTAEEKYRTRPPRPLSAPIREINAIESDSVSNTLFAGCGDGRLHAFALITGKPILSSKPEDSHTDMILCMTCIRDAEGRILSIFTGGEDGQVKQWNPTTLECTKSFKPFNLSANASASAPGAAGSSKKHAAPSSFVSALCVDKSGTWLACGGSPQYITVYLLPRMTLSSILPTCGPTYVLYTAPHDPDSLWSAGEEIHVYQWKWSGKLVDRMETQMAAIYSLAAAKVKDASLLAIGGSGYKIQLLRQIGQPYELLSWE